MRFWRAPTFYLKVILLFEISAISPGLLASTKFTLKKKLTIDATALGQVKSSNKYKFIAKLAYGKQSNPDESSEHCFLCYLYTYTVM